MVRKGYKNSFEKEEWYVSPNSKLGSPTSPMTPKQLAEFSSRLNEGVMNVEVGTIQPDKFDEIPMEHFEAIKQLSKITGSNVSVHAPIIDPAGFDDKGNWTEHQRKVNQNQIVSILDKSSKLSKNGTIPVVLHGTAGVFSKQHDAALDNQIEWVEYTAKGKSDPKKDDQGNIRYREGLRSMTAVDQSEGKLVANLEYEEKHMPGNKKEVWDPWRRLHSANVSKWDSEKLQAFSYQNDLSKLEERQMKLMQKINSIKKSGLVNLDENGNPKQGQFSEWEKEYVNAKMGLATVDGHIKQIDKSLGSHLLEMHHKVAKYKPVSDTEEYKKYQKEFPKYQKTFAELENKIDGLKNQLESNRNFSEDERKNMFNEYQQLSTIKDSQLLHHITNLPTPELIKPTSEFAMEKTVETVAGAMHDLYRRKKKEKGFGGIETLPTLAIENVSPNMPLGTAAELKKAIEDSRKAFAAKLVEHDKFNKKKANAVAKKLIGATWDVGHINLLRRAGYTEEGLKKRTIEESKEIAPVVKHLHITDNFGFGDTHLPPGMGNVPIREIVEVLEKQGFEGRRIIEAGNFVKEFGISPTHDVLEYFKSPIYSDTDASLYRMGNGPYWQPEAFPAYGSNFVEFPQQNFNLYGSSFTSLPEHFGGQVGGDKSRFSGTPNA
jgi:hypothetical protein